METTSGFNDELALKIFEAVSDKTKHSDVIPEKYSVFPYFFNLPISSSISNNIVIGGPNLPMISVIGESGRIYFFALRALLSEEEINDALRSK